MRTADELVNRVDPCFPLIQQWADSAVRPVEFLPPSETREDALVQTQVTTRSPLGAVVYETGGILVDGGWLRVLGSGHPRLTRSLPGWNHGRSDGFCLVGDDAIGGFFAINGGAFGDDVQRLYYFAPDSLNWEPLAIGYASFLQWLFSGDLDQFYTWIRWNGWDRDARSLHGDLCYFFYPFLCTEEGKGGRGQRSAVPVDESWHLQMNLRQKLGPAT